MKIAYEETLLREKIQAAGARWNHEQTPSPGFSGTPIVTLDGTNAFTSGLWISGGAPNTIRCLVIVNFPGYGIVVTGGGATIVGNYIGIDATGVAAGNYAGVLVQNTNGVVVGSPSVADRNVISANDDHGIILFGGTDDNVVQGNFIGLDVTGSMDMGNGFDGIAIDAGDNNQVIGNAISGNAMRGIFVSSRNSVIPDIAIGNRIQGNLIGTDVTGSVAVPNVSHGIVLIGTRQTTIGGTSAGTGNTISGNSNAGVLVSVATGVGGPLRSEDTVISGNFIGTDSSGTMTLGNATSGILLHGALDTTIGAAAGNVISGNAIAGITTMTEILLDPVLSVTTTSGTIVTNNRIGTDITGTSALGNGGCGVSITIERE